MSDPTAHRLAMLELAPRVHNRKGVTPGVGYSRSVVDRPEKEIARRWLRRRYSRARWPGTLSIVTMPGLRWQFENELLTSREPKSVFQKEGTFIGTRTKRTQITSIEREPAIFVASLRSIPGGRVSISERPVAEYASRSLSTGLIRRYHLCTAEAFMVSDGPPNDVAWFDFNGPLTTERIDGLIQHWNNRVRHTLVVTGMTGRTSSDVTALIHGAGGEAPALRGLCEGAEVVLAMPYQDTTPMFQVALTRETA